MEAFFRMVIEDVSSVFLSELFITFQEHQITDVNRDKSLGHSELLQADRVGVGTVLPPFVQTLHSPAWKLFPFHYGLYVFNFILNPESEDTEHEITNKSLSL